MRCFSPAKDAQPPLISYCWRILDRGVSEYGQYDKVEDLLDCLGDYEERNAAQDAEMTRWLHQLPLGRITKLPNGDRIVRCQV